MGDSLEERLLRTYPILLVAVLSLIDDHSLLGLGVEGCADVSIMASFEMLEVSDAVFGQWIIHQHLLGQRHIPGVNLFSCWCVTSGEVERLVVVLQEERFEVCQCVLLAEQAPYSVFVVRIAVVELYGFYFGKLLNQSLIDGEILLSVLSWRFVLMLTNALLQELRHLEVRIPQQGRDTHDGCQHLGIERTTAVAHQKVWLLTVNKFTDELDSFLRMHRKVWRKHLCTTLEGIAQCQGWYALATGIEAV